VRVDQADVGIRVELALEGGVCSGRHPHRHAETARAAGRAAAMIAVFMGNQDRGKLAVMAVVPRQARAGFARGESAVEQECGAAALDQRGIAAAAAAEDCKTKSRVLQSQPAYFS
jgi:hypothetical protein